MYKFRKPKHGAFYHYCGDCKYFEFREQIGCAYLGICTTIENEPTEQDAYDKPCGVWKPKR